MKVTTPKVDLTDLEAFMAGEHHAMFDWLRANDPVYWQPTADGGFWSLTKYDDCVAAYREHGVFSSTNGPMLVGSFRSAADTAAGGMPVASDPPQLRHLRRALGRLFAQTVLKRVSKHVDALMDKAIARAVDSGGCDFATDVARDLPTGALMGMMDLPYSDAHYLIRLTHDMIDFRDTNYVKTDEEARMRLANIQAEIFEFFVDLIARRRGAPGDDLIGILLAADINGRPMREDEILYTCLNVAVGGNTTSVYSACAGLIMMMEHPDQFELLVRRPELLGSALDEILRCSAPNAYDHRVAKRDAVIGTNGSSQATR